jgi:hypothetical protein
LTTGELVDLFGVSGAVAEQAGYTEDEAIQMVDVVGALGDEEIYAIQL